MGIKKLIARQTLPISLDEAWDFFSSPANLNEITPESMSFVIKSELPEKMYAGMMIHYKVTPLLGIPMGWTTEITHVREKIYFVDEQRSGPYRMWHHEHHFEQTPEGVLMTDVLHYDIGKSIFGYMAGVLFVDEKVKSIFEFRKQKLEQLFGKA